jgi:hypothetical protein
MKIKRLDWWLAQQCRWPPALPVFPANREFCREFCKIAALGTPETTSNAVITGFPTQIPYSTKQGIIFAEQEIWAGEQGILSAETKFSQDEIFGTVLDDVRCCPESGQ